MVKSDNLADCAMEWMSFKRSGLDIYSLNLKCVNLADFTSWIEIKDFNKFEILEVISLDQSQCHIRSVILMFVTT